MCSRFVVWASPSTPLSAPWLTAECALFNGMGNYVDYLGGWSLPAGAPIYSGSACATAIGTTGPNLVYAANTAEADAKCDAAFPGTRASNPGGLVGNNYSCV